MIYVACSYVVEVVSGLEINLGKSELIPVDNTNTIEGLARVSSLPIK